MAKNESEMAAKENLSAVATENDAREALNEENTGGTKKRRIMQSKI
jgi:hypothetical protein